MAENQILPFAQGQGANVLSQADYAGDSMRLQGHQPGVARSALENKALLQCSSMAAGLAQFIADGQADDVTDAKTPAEIAAMLANANAFVSQFTDANGYVVIPAKPNNIIIQTMRVIHGSQTGQDFVLPTSFAIGNFACFASYNHIDEYVDTGPLTIAPNGRQSVRVWKSSTTRYSIGILAFGV